MIMLNLKLKIKCSYHLVLVDILISKPTNSGQKTLWLNQDIHKTYPYIQESRRRSYNAPECIGSGGTTFASTCLIWSLFFYQLKHDLSTFQTIKKVPRELCYPLKPSRIQKNQVFQLEPKSLKKLQRLVSDFVFHLISFLYFYIMNLTLVVWTLYKLS